MENILSQVRKELKRNIDEKTKAAAQNFFKEKIKFYGVRVPIVNKTASFFYRKYLEKLSKKEIFELCTKLWKSGYLEETFIACSWSYFTHKLYEPKDFKVFEDWLKKYADNWASCDTLCNHTIGEFLEMYPEHVSELKKWTKSNNRWVRRGAAAALIIPARKGLFLNDIFEIADSLLSDKDDLVQKGCGWMLKAASESGGAGNRLNAAKAVNGLLNGKTGKSCKIKKSDRDGSGKNKLTYSKCGKFDKSGGKDNMKKVFDYVMQHKNKMPGTALRYAVEKMPPEMKKQSMAR